MKVNSRNHILETLREHSHTGKTYTTGEELATLLGISRVAVWKHIKNLREEGYPLESGREGYRYLPGRDILLPGEVADIPLIHYQEISSTMEPARKQALEGCRDFTTVVAEDQTNGRGRGEHHWESSRGGLYFTTVLHPRIPAGYQNLFSLAACTAVASTLRKRGIDATVKWPNDVLVGKAKIAGVLTENLLRSTRIEWVNIGIGININNPSPAEQAVSMAGITGDLHSRNLVLRETLAYLRELTEEESPTEIIHRWESYWPHRNRFLHARLPDGRRIKGPARGLDRTGNLILGEEHGYALLPGDFMIKEDE